MGGHFRSARELSAADLGVGLPSPRAPVRSDGEREAMLRLLAQQRAELEEQNAALEAIHAVSSAVGSSIDRGVVVQRAGLALRGVLRARGLVVEGLDAGTGRRYVLWDDGGEAAPRVDGEQWDYLRWLCDHAVERGEVATSAEHLPRGGKLAAGRALLLQRAGLLCAVPLVAAGETQGLLRIVLGGATALSSQERGALRAIGQAIGMAMFNAGQVECIARGQQARASLEAQLRQSQRLETIGRLAGGIAHDFNNILTPILTSAELALDELAGEARRAALAESLEVIHGSARRAKDLVSQILLFGRETRGDRQPGEVVGIVKEAMNLARASLPATVEVRLALSAEPQRALVDVGQLHQAVLNLATNAAQAIGARAGVVSVAVDAARLPAKLAGSHPTLVDTALVRVRVADSGPGMDEETLRCIFEPFFTTRGVGEGSGLGLSVVHGIVSAHGGAITASSEPGTGTTIDIYLPRLVEQPSRFPGSPVPGARGGERVLIVDDEQPVARIAERILRRHGYEVVTAPGPEEAMRCFEGDGRGFQLVLTDQTMPGMTGIELGRRLRAACPGLPLVLMTGYPDDDVKAGAGEAYGQLLLKPFDVETITRTVREALDAGEQEVGD